MIKPDFSRGISLQQILIPCVHIISRLPVFKTSSISKYSQRSMSHITTVREEMHVITQKLMWPLSLYPICHICLSQLLWKRLYRRKCMFARRYQDGKATNGICISLPISHLWLYENSSVLLYISVLYHIISLLNVTWKSWIRKRRETCHHHRSYSCSSSAACGTRTAVAWEQPCHHAT